HLDLPPLRGLAGAIRLPGSKSISNRVLLLAALAHGVTHVRDLLESDDTGYMLAALEALGVYCVAGHGHRITRARGTFPGESAALYHGNAGPATRPATAVRACWGGRYRIAGAPRMHERPIGALVDALREMGADVASLARDGFPPLHVGPGAIVPGVSARVRGD